MRLAVSHRRRRLLAPILALVFCLPLFSQCSFFGIPVPLNNPVDPGVGYRFGDSWGEPPYLADRSAPAGATGLSVSSDGTYAVTLAPGIGSMFVIDLATGAVSTEIYPETIMDGGQSDIVLDSDTSTVYLTGRQALRQIDLQTQEVTRLADLSDDNVTFCGISLDKPNEQLVVSRCDGNDHSYGVYVCDLASGSLTDFPLPAFFDNSDHFDEAFVATPAYLVFATRDNGLVLIDRDGSAHRRIYWDWGEGQYVGEFVDPDTMSDVGGLGDCDLAVDEEGSILAMIQENGQAVVRFDPDAALPELELYGQGDDIRYQHRSFVASGPDSSVYVLDEFAMRIVRYDAPQPDPYTVVYQAAPPQPHEFLFLDDLALTDTGILYATAQNYDRVLVFDPAISGDAAWSEFPAGDDLRGPDRIATVRVAGQLRIIVSTHQGVVFAFAQTGAEIGRWYHSHSGFASMIAQSDGSVMTAVRGSWSEPPDQFFLNADFSVTDGDPIRALSGYTRNEPMIAAAPDGTIYYAGTREHEPHDVLVGIGPANADPVPFTDATDQVFLADENGISDDEHWRPWDHGLADLTVTDHHVWVFLGEEQSIVKIDRASREVLGTLGPFHNADPDRARWHRGVYAYNYTDYGGARALEVTPAGQVYVGGWGRVVRYDPY